MVARVAAAAPKAHGQHIYLSVGEKEGAGKPGGSTQMTHGQNGLMKALKGPARRDPAECPALQR